MIYNRDKSGGTQASASVTAGSHLDRNGSQDEPTSQGTPSSGIEGNDLRLTVVKELHWLLAARYADILDRASQPWLLLPHKPRKTRIGKLCRSLRSKVEGARTAHRNAVRHRPITRILVESHIRRKLHEIQAIYIQIEQSLPIDEQECQPFREWLKESQDSCGRWISTLTSWASVRGLLTVFWAAALGLTTAWLGANNIWNAIWSLGHDKPATDWITFSVIAVVMVMYAGILSRITFDRKRRLFLEKAPVSARSDPSLPSMMNAYELEDALFRNLHRQKNLELPIDTLGLFAGIAGLLVFSIVNIWLGGGSGALWGVLGILFFGGGGVQMLLRYRKEAR